MGGDETKVGYGYSSWLLMMEVKAMARWIFFECIVQGGANTFLYVNGHTTVRLG
jgi:hypothetical protein